MINKHHINRFNIFKRSNKHTYFAGDCFWLADIMM